MTAPASKEVGLRTAAETLERAQDYLDMVEKDWPELALPIRQIRTGVEDVLVHAEFMAGYKPPKKRT